jgi:hypothetical protein
MKVASGRGTPTALEIWRLAALGLVVLLRLPAGTPQETLGGSGSPACPCIDPWPSPSAGGTCRSLRINREHDFGVTNFSEVCVPMNYGARVCTAWDNASWNSACLGSDGSVRDSGAPEWCTAAWCYVDPDDCERPMDPADIAGSDGSGLRLHYSYETCGNLNTYSDERHYRYLRGRHIRVSYPGDSGSGYTLKTLSDGTKTGSMVEFMRTVAAEAQFTWEEVPLQEASRSRYSSSFTACVHQVALNETDMCIGNFWVTPERTLLAGFTAAVYDDEFKLIVRATIERTIWDKVGRPFTMTLTPGAWGWVITTLCAMSFAMVYIEGVDVGDSADAILRELQRGDERSNNIQSTLGGSQGPDGTVAHKQGCCRKPRWRHLWQATGASIYYGFLGLTGASPKHEAQKGPGMLVILGFAIFVLLFVSSYTGATAAVFIAESGRSATLGSLEELNSSGGKLCIMTAQKTAFELRYPEFGGRLLPKKLADEVLQDFDDGKCTGAILFNDGWKNALAGKFPTRQNDGSRLERNHCDKVAAGGSVLSIANAMPVRADLQEPLSYLISRKRLNNEYVPLPIRIRVPETSVRTLSL